MSNLKYIEGGWDGYRHVVIPADASEVQVAESRQAFFAGAAVLFQTVMLALDPVPGVTDSDIKVMEALQTEIDAFGLEIDLKLMPAQGHG